MSPEREQKLADKIENLGSGLANIGLLAVTSQTFWPMPGFIMPHGIVNAFFYIALGGTGLRTLAKPLAGLIAFFVKNGDLPTPSKAI